MFQPGDWKLCLYSRNSYSYMYMSAFIRYGWSFRQGSLNGYSVFREITKLKKYHVVADQHQRDGGV